jgi:hypothetical protein
MKFQITMNNATFSVETEGDDLNITDMVNHFKGLLVLCGYHPKGVDEAFIPDEFEWFPEPDQVDPFENPPRTEEEWTEDMKKHPHRDNHMD